MGTRAAAFAGKISNLLESLSRIQNGTLPQPTCLDLANMLKYFCQVLHDFRDFKDIENVPLYACEKKDRMQLIRTLPNFDYSGLYKALEKLVHVLHLIPQTSNGFDVLGQNLLMLFKCLVLFLDQSNMETMPFLVTTLFRSLPQTLYKDILDTLCYNILPFTIDQQQRNIANNNNLSHQRSGKSRSRGGGSSRRSNRSAGVATKTGVTHHRHHYQRTTRHSHKSEEDSIEQKPQQHPHHCIVRIEDDTTGHCDSDDIKVASRQVSKLRSIGDDNLDQGIVMVDYDEEDTVDAGDGAKPDDAVTGTGFDSTRGKVVGGGDSLSLSSSSSSSSSSSLHSEDYAMLSVTGILMIAFHYINDPMHNSQLIECLMKLKNNVFEDLLFVIAYGTTRARCPAVELLFRYWPDICPTQQDRKSSNQGSKLKHIPWQPTKCQNRNCSFTTLDDDEAVKMCLDFKISITLSDLPPPMLVCLDCVDSIYKQQLAQPPTISISASDSIQPHQPLQQHRHRNSSMSPIYDYGNKFIDLLLPMERVSRLCENKKCKSTDRTAIGTCFDIECANYNGKRPIRYCKTCYISIHEPCEANNYDVTLQNHIRHSSISLTVMDNEESINNFVEAIISLLKEAAPADKPSKDSERYLRALGPMHFASENKEINSIATEEKQLTSQYGIWLMTGLSESGDKLSDELLGRLLGMLFQWFHFTACLPDDQAGSALEKLKGECIKGWLMDVKAKRMDVFISCLLPHPIDCSKIGGHWEVWPDTAYQIKEGFKRLLCLVPYDIITNDVWDEIMPYWMECFRHEVPEEELSELKILLSKVFDPELSPLGFETKQMYNFISSRFADPTNPNQEQTLYWLQIITMLEIPIPIDFLFQMFQSGVKSLAEMRRQELNQLRAASRLAADLKASVSDTRQQAAASAQQQQHQSKSRSPALSDESGEAMQGRPGQVAHMDHQRIQSPTLSLSASCGAISEDDVMLPSSGTATATTSATKIDQRPQRPLTLQERQARARAAFSAKLMQQASILDAQHSQSIGSQGSVTGTNQQQPTLPVQSISSSLSTPAQGSGFNYDNQWRQQQLLTQQQQDQHQVAGKPLMPKSSSLAPMTHTQPLRSIAADSNESCSTNSPAALGSHEDYNVNIEEGEESASRPKLRLNLDATDCVEADLSSGSQQDQRSSQQQQQQAQAQLQQQQQQQQQMINKIDNNLLCYILMLDILLQQLNLQEISSHRGLDGREAQQAIYLLNTIISTPWIGRHTCYTDNDNCCTTDKGSQGSGGSRQQPQHDTNIYRSAGPKSLAHCVQGFERQDEASSETCVYCEMISFFHQLAMSLIEYFSLVIEVSICDITQDAANSEFEGRPDYSRIGLDHLSAASDTSMRDRPKEDTLDGQIETGRKFDFSPKAQQKQKQQHQHHHYSESLLSPFTPHYTGPTLRQEVLETLPKELQLTYNLLMQFHQYQTPDIVSQLLQMIKLISLHAQVLSKASKTNPDFISWCQHNMLINKLWTLCQDESSEIARTCVPLLMHCITLPWGVRLFRDLVERDFNSDNWLSRFGAVERVVTIAYFCEPATIKNSTLLQSTMASAFCYVVKCLDDIEAIVAQRALVSLEMMKTSSLKLLLWCLEVQFDCIIIDRPIILRAVFQLYNHLRDRRFLTWEFFLNRFDTIFLEAQIYLQQTGEIPSFTMQDLKNTNTKSEIYQKKIMRAKESLQETHLSRSIWNRLNEKQLAERMQSMKTTTTTTISMAQHDAEMTTAVVDYKESIRLQQQMDSDNYHRPKTFVSELDKRVSPLKRVMQHGTSTSSRYQSVAYLTSQSLAKRENSKFMSNLAMQSVPLMIPDKLHQHLPNSFVDDGSKLNEIAQENHVFGVIHRVCDEDRDTNHSLIFLLMQFFSKPDPSHPQTVKALNRSHQIVLRHLNILMGYSIARKNFLITAANLRLLPVFNAFLTSLPKVLDFNYSLGTILLETCLPVLVYCPAHDNVQYDSLGRPTYSLWLLNPLMRQSWLLSVMTFLYKYQFSQPHLQEQVFRLMWIVINTLESHLNFSAIDSSTAAVDRCMLGVQHQQQQPTHHQPQHQPSQQQTAATPRSTTGASVEATTSQADLSSANPAKQSLGNNNGNKRAAANESKGEQDTSTSAKNKDSSQVSAASSRTAGAPGTAETIEMQPMKNEASSEQHKLHPSNSSSSMVSDRHLSYSTSPPKATATDTAAAAVVKQHQLVKADTSESLGLKNRLFQRAQRVPVGGEQQHQQATSSSKSIAAPGAAADSAAAFVGQQQQQQQTGAAGDGGERLLPIGLHHKRYQSSDMVERLLPIGQAPLSTSSSSSLSSATWSKTQQPADRLGGSNSKQILGFAADNESTAAASPAAAAPSKMSSAPAAGVSGDPDQQQQQTSGERHSDQQPASVVAGKKVAASQSSAAAAAAAAAKGESPTVSSSSGEQTASRPQQHHKRFGGPAKVQLKGPDEQAHKQVQADPAADGPAGATKSPTAAASLAGVATCTAATTTPATTATTTATTALVAEVTGTAKAIQDKKNKKANNKENYYQHGRAGQGFQSRPSGGSGEPAGAEGSSSQSLLEEQLAQLNKHSIVQEFSDKDLSMCLVILETFIHHEPSMAAQMLPNILRLVARYSSAATGPDSWQTGCSNAQHVGGSMFVARQFIRVALHDLMENKIFHQIFTSHFTGHDFYKSMATALADFPDLNQLAPLSKLFEDLNKQKNLPQASSLMTILENVATYFECIIADSASYSQTTWNNFIVNWENFLRKLILALPRYSGAAVMQPNAAAAAAGSAKSATVALANNTVNASVVSPTVAAQAAAQAAGMHGHAPSSLGVGVAGAGGVGNVVVAGANDAAAAAGVAAPCTLAPGGATTSTLSAAAQAAHAGASAAAGAPAGAPLAAATAAAAATGATTAATAATGSNIFFSPIRFTLSGQQDALSLGTGGASAAAAATPSSCSLIMAPIMRIILSTSRISQLASCKTIVDPYSKIISYTVLNSQFKYEHLLEINHNCCRVYTRDREKYLIQRTIAYELVQVLKFRFFILEENLLLLLLFILQDVGGTLSPKVVDEGLKIDKSTLNHADSYVTNVSECLRQHIGDFLEFITDVHAISRMHENLIGPQPPLINRDSFGGHVKAAISQYLALEMSLATVSDNRTVLRYLPWLYSSPSLHQGPREFIDCVSHIRQLSWIILGSLQHSALMRNDQSNGSSLGSAYYNYNHNNNTTTAAGNSNGGATNSASNPSSQQQQQQTSSSAAAAAASSSAAANSTSSSSATAGASSSSSSTYCQPIPIEKSSNVAEHVQVILAGFAEQSKESVLHMSGLFHAFLLCQLWTMYCGNICLQHAPNSEQYQFCQSTLDDFWAKVTPGVLRLVSHSRVMSEMVSTHFLQLIESLIESNSSVLIRYLPMWNSVFYSYKRRNKSGNIAIRLQKCIEWQPPDLSEPNAAEQNNKCFMSWLEKVQYKMSHIEIQSSQAAPFYLT